MAALAGITCHASKIVPVFALWVRVCPCEIARWRAEARAMRASVRGYVPTVQDAAAFALLAPDQD